MKAIDKLNVIFTSEDRAHRATTLHGLVILRWEFGGGDTVPESDVAVAVDYWLSTGQYDERNGWSRFFDLLTNSIGIGREAS